MEKIFVGDINTKTAIYGKHCWDNSIINYNSDYKYYWIDIGVFGLEKHIYGNGISIIVASGTKEYDELTELIKRENNDTIEIYANKLVIKYGDPDEVYKMIEKIKSVKYKQGRKDVQDEMRKALGLYERGDGALGVEY